MQVWDIAMLVAISEYREAQNRIPCMQPRKFETIKIQLILKNVDVVAEFNDAIAYSDPLALQVQRQG